MNNAATTYEIKKIDDDGVTRFFFIRTILQERGSNLAKN